MYRWRWTAMAGVVLALAAPVSARYEFQERVLENGMRVITLEDFSCPVVAVQVWYHVGSKNEDPQRQGFAHMFEHMMFRGTERLGPTDHFNFVRGTGGNCNAYTSFDQTVYVNYVPADQLPLVLWLEAERMAFLRINEYGFSTERKVVEEERRLGLNRPYGTVFEKVLPVIFKVHPYRWTPIGRIPHLRAARVEELQAFWDRYYVPNNATLVIVGAVPHEKAQRMAEEAFGWIPRFPDPPPLDVSEPPQTEPREILVEEPKGPAPVVGYAFRAVPVKHPDFIPLQVATSILGEGQSSRLYVDLVKEQKLAMYAGAAAVGFEDEGVVAVGAVLKPFGNRVKAMNALTRQIRRMREEPVSERELRKAINRLLRQQVTQSLTVASKASRLGFAAVIYGDTDWVNREPEAIRSVTREDVQRVCQKYFIKERSTKVYVKPSVAGMLKSLVGGGPAEDEGAPPPPEPATGPDDPGPPSVKDALRRPEALPDKPPVAAVRPALPKIEDVGIYDRARARAEDVRDVVPAHRLPNGLRVVVVENHEVPFVTMQLGLLDGAWTEDPDMPGVAAMACAMITEGTENYTARELADELETYAISLSGYADMDYASVTASCLSEQVERAMRLLAEVVQRPTFPEEEFRIRLDQTRTAKMVSEKEPGYVADRELRRRIFREHFYARTASGELADLDNLRREALPRWWREHVRPDRAVLYVAGDIERADAFRLAERYLGEWEAVREPAPPDVPDVPEPAPTRIFLVDRPGLVQSEIRIGHIGITRKDSAYFATRVFNQVFGGSFASRLNDALRVKRGLTYGIRGGFEADRFAGRFVIRTFSKTPKTAEALRVILDEIQRIKTEPPTPEEMQAARNYLLGSFAVSRETPGSIIDDLWLLEREGLPADYFVRYLDAVATTDASTVASIAGRLVRGDRLAIVVVGDAARIRDALAEIAPVTVISAGSDATSGSDEPESTGR